MTNNEPVAKPPYIEHDELFNKYQPYLHNVGAYKPVYFLAGADPEDTKFQFSLKYRFISRDGLMKAAHSWIRGFHVAYTQTSFWDLDGDSKPFEDTSYKPEAFYLTPNLFSGTKASHMFIQAGYEHESNGQAGDSSRSTNFLYIQPIYVYFHKKSDTVFQVSPRVWAYVNNNHNTNKSLHRYRGYFCLGLKLGRADGVVFESRWRWAQKGHSIIMDASYPLDELIGFNLQLYLHAQYADALAESLINFTERNRSFRIGVSIIR
jgi:phospholipase A1/A2